MVDHPRCILDLTIHFIKGCRSINKQIIIDSFLGWEEIDIGQLEGAFVMSLGLWMTEEIKYNPDTGRLVTADTWEYKPPASHDIPEDLRTTFYNGKNGPSGVFGSKATGEPSVLMGVSSLLAIHRALAEARNDLGKDPKGWFQLSGPATCERVQLSSEITSENFLL